MKFFLFQTRWNRPPIIFQTDKFECGVACLTSILRYWRYRVQLSNVRKHFQVTDKGMPALELARVGRLYGLQVRAYRLNELTSLKFIQFPIIAHWNENHFVVIEHWDEKRIIVMDPGNGRMRITVEEFAKNFSGTILTFYR